ncbi:hypothetical protein ABH920_002883 [Catenulispora sp. EB89]|uniref:hypothetical protein n=1 Tax=Catenulispora sp. EB89 TaxID=3156257 RepID=UPI003517AC24
MSGEQEDQSEHSEGLERRYRRLLRILPKRYREARAEELLSVLMETSAQGRRWPEVREALSLARLGIRVRMGRESGGAVVDTRAGAMARAVGITGTMLLAFIGATSLGQLMGNLMQPPGLVVWTYWHPFTWTIAHGQPYPFGLESEIGHQAVPAGWLLVLGLLALGWWRAARVAGLALFLVSAYLTVGTETILHEETVLAGVVTAALFAVRGVHARPVRLAGSVGFAAVLGTAYWAFKLHSGLELKAVLALQGWGITDDTHALAMVAAAMVVLGIVAYRSAVWPVALAVVGTAALGPVLVRVSVHPNLQGSDLVPLAFLAGSLVLVAGLAVVKEGRTGRTVRGGRPALPIS